MNLEAIPSKKNSGALQSKEHRNCIQSLTFELKSNPANSPHNDPPLYWK